MLSTPEANTSVCSALLRKFSTRPSAAHCCRVAARTSASAATRGAICASVAATMRERRCVTQAQPAGCLVACLRTLRGRRAVASLRRAVRQPTAAAQDRARSARTVESSQRCRACALYRRHGEQPHWNNQQHAARTRSRNARPRRSRRAERHSECPRGAARELRGKPRAAQAAAMCMRPHVRGTQAEARTGRARQPRTCAVATRTC